ncbi:hypothetical protein LVB87_15595 [Lysobacter sp. KIS68-7]|uniref:hypothetical protein n=1 Tax=Lysobacter sp. KIS68-7 TaxID=2904252 RepID=UPI001E2E912D|nr:hypothetical protein [Lysobacter sp. KIS68-7]UHQ19590.1 hypothetical protein LVB87_15595 [Lysobacter sp. KIS68-7]
MLVKVIGFLVGFAVVAAGEVALLAALNLNPRGAGWIAAPIMVGIAFAGAAPGLVERFSRSGESLWRQSSSVRLVAVLCALWLVGVPVYWWLFEPYDYAMGSDDWALMFKTMFFPIALLIVGFVAYVKVVVPQPSSGSSEGPTERAPAVQIKGVSAPASSMPPDASSSVLAMATDDRAALASLITVIQRRQATIETYMQVASGFGGSLTPKGFLFDSHYVIEIDGVRSRVDSFEDLRQWFLDNVAPRIRDRDLSREASEA